MLLRGRLANFNFCYLEHMKMNVVFFIDDNYNFSMNIKYASFRVKVKSECTKQFSR